MELPPKKPDTFIRSRMPSSSRLLPSVSTSSDARRGAGPLELGEAADHLHHHPTGEGRRVYGLGQASKPASAASIFSRMCSRSFSERDRRSSFQTMTA